MPLTIELLALFVFFSLNVTFGISALTTFGKSEVVNRKPTIHNEQSFEVHHDFPNASISGSLLNSVASFMICGDIETSSDGKYSRKCEVTHGKVGLNRRLEICNLTFHGQLTDDYEIHAVSEDEAMIIWIDNDENSTEHSLRYTFVNMYECESHEYEVYFDDYESANTNLRYYGEALVINKDGSYDVFYENIDTCGEKVCRLTIDPQKNTTKGPIAAYVPSNNNSILITEESPINDSIAIAEIGVDSGEFRMSLITPDGVKLLKEFPLEEFNVNESVRVNHGVIRSCSKKGDEKIECEVLDTTGKSTSKSTVNLANQHFSKFELHNLPNGEFALLTENSQQVNVTKVYADNQLVGPIELPKVHVCDDNIKTAIRDITNREDRWTCVSTLCYDNQHADLTQNCFAQFW